MSTAARLRVEFHCHTTASHDGLTSPGGLVEACRREGLDRVIVTDHNTIEGALEAQRIDPTLVIVGEEIMTTAGELLAAFVSEEVPSGLEPMEAIRRLSAQGAFISVSHPFDWFRSPWESKTLVEILPHIDAIETFNARCLFQGFNRASQKFARRHGLPGTSGSDAHTPDELGFATMLLDPFDGAPGLKEVIGYAKPQNRSVSPWLHFASRRAAQSRSR
jgi:hypothetical protein